MKQLIFCTIAFVSLTIANDTITTEKSHNAVCVDHYEKFKQDGVPEEQVRANIKVVEDALVTTLKYCFLEERPEPMTYEEFLNNIISICRESNQE